MLLFLTRIQPFAFILGISCVCVIFTVLTSWMTGFTSWKRIAQNFVIFIFVISAGACRNASTVFKTELHIFTTLKIWFQSYKKHWTLHYNLWIDWKFKFNIDGSIILIVWNSMKSHDGSNIFLYNRPFAALLKIFTFQFNGALRTILLLTDFTYT